ncbi:MAG TPA: endolytic transglycosylase MltG [Candidatus Paceibacterota bacterium]|nr:MAG: hypothetical protein B7X03_00065 [Parcubacteria group bacterium 21-58-10]HQT82879.1 endolytic transglycosylase MltG [Candidatus Paceibacterota bacterium]
MKTIPSDSKSRPQQNTKSRFSRLLWSGALAVAVTCAVLYAVPFFFTLSVQYEQSHSSASAPFPVTVYPKDKLIVEDPQVNAFLENPNSPLAAAVGDTGNALWSAFRWLALTIAGTAAYQDLAAADGRFVTIAPGMRKEQAAEMFGKALSWNAAQKKKFLTATATSSLPLVEGSFAPGTYLVTVGMAPQAVQALVNERFTQDVLNHYATSTAAVVPLSEALTIASLIERETIGTTDMRLVSGIIWNRLFANMNLQIDSTLQYAKANTAAATSWWPTVVPADMYRRSPYNTYLHSGLPPTPIANPSVAAVLAALNPLQTSCLYYFNDQAGNIHCSDTYAEHVALLKKYYGQGK